MGVTWRGIFDIPATPFDQSDRIDEGELAAEVELSVAGKVGGLCVPVMVSEFEALSERERRTMVEVPVRVAAGRLPVIANVAAVEWCANGG